MRDGVFFLCRQNWYVNVDICHIFMWWFTIIEILTILTKRFSDFIQMKLDKKKTHNNLYSKENQFRNNAKILEKPFLSYFKSDGISFLFSTWGSLLKHFYCVLFSEFGHFRNFTFQFQNNTKSNVMPLFELQIVRVIFFQRELHYWSIQLNHYVSILH